MNMEIFYNKFEYPFGFINCHGISDYHTDI